MTKTARTKGNPDPSQPQSGPQSHTESPISPDPVSEDPAREMDSDSAGPLAGDNPQATGTQAGIPVSQPAPSIETEVSGPGLQELDDTYPFPHPSPSGGDNGTPDNQAEPVPPISLAQPSSLSSLDQYFAARFKLEMDQMKRKEEETRETKKKKKSKSRKRSRSSSSSSSGSSPSDSSDEDRKRRRKRKKHRSRRRRSPSSSDRAQGKTHTYQRGRALSSSGPYSTVAGSASPSSSTLPLGLPQLELFQGNPQLAALAQFLAASSTATHPQRAPTVPASATQPSTSSPSATQRAMGAQQAGASSQVPAGSQPRAASDTSASRGQATTSTHVASRLADQTPTLSANTSHSARLSQSGNTRTPLPVPTAQPPTPLDQDEDMDSEQEEAMEEELRSLASRIGQPGLADTYDLTQAPRLENLSDISMSRTPSIKNLDTREEDDEASLTAQRLTTHTKSLLAKLKPLAEKLVVEKEEQSQPPASQGEWANLGLGLPQEQDLAFARSQMIEDAVTRQFDRAISDKCSQSHGPRGVPLRPVRDRFARFQGKVTRASTPAEPNLPQAFLPKAGKETSHSAKFLRLAEEVSRRTLNGLNQVDALKNAAATTMLQKTADSASKRAWGPQADPNLLLEILHNIHQTVEHIAQLQGHLFTAALLERRTAALAESAATQEIKNTLLQSPPFSKGLFDEENIKTAKKELESEVVTRSLMRPAMSQARNQHRPQRPRHRQGGNAKSSTPNSGNRPKQQAQPSSSNNQPSDRQPKTVTPRAFGHSYQKGNFPSARMLPGRKK